MAKRGKKALNYYEAHPNKKPKRIQPAKGRSRAQMIRRRIAQSIVKKFGTMSSAAAICSAAICGAIESIRQLTDASKKLQKYKRTGIVSSFINGLGKEEVIIMPDGVFKSIPWPPTLVNPIENIGGLPLAAMKSKHKINDIKKYLEIQGTDQQDPGDEHQPKKS